jgi:hypothetical protein
MKALNFPGVFREPLVQFLLLGALVFGIDQVAQALIDDPRRIVIDDDRLTELVAIFEEGQGRAPDPEEVEALIVKWTQNEILYREARLMGLDEGDEMIRSRLILKLRNILFNNAVVDAPRDGELQEFFEFNRAAYDVPTRYDFEQFALDTAISDAGAAELAESIVDGEPPESQVDAVRRYEQRPAANLAALFGDEAAARLETAPTGTWVPVRGDRGWHLARIIRVHASEPVELEAVRSQVVRDWKKFRNDIQLADQTKAIADRYDILVQLSPEAQRRLDGVEVPGESASVAQTAALD